MNLFYYVGIIEIYVLSAIAESKVRETSGILKKTKEAFQMFSESILKM